MCVLATQSCLPLCDAMDCGPRGSSVHGSLQARIWSGLPFPPPGDLPNPGIELASPVSPALQAGFFIAETPRKPYADKFSVYHYISITSL